MSINFLRETCGKAFLGKTLAGCLAASISFIVFPNSSQGVSCHCFRERAFKPSQPASADPYILATTRNSLVAAASDIEKGIVVRMRMKGTTETDLWLSNYLPAKIDIKYSELLSVRDSTTSWAAALDAINLDPSMFGPAFKEALKAGDDDAMARALADQVLGKTFGIEDATLRVLKRKQASIAEASLSLFLAARTGRTPADILNEVRKGRQTWGSLLHAQGIKVDTIGDLIEEKVRERL
jgi:hypothetical protein